MSSKSSMATTRSGGYPQIKSQIHAGSQTVSGLAEKNALLARPYSPLVGDPAAWGDGVRFMEDLQSGDAQIVPGQL